MPELPEVQCVVNSLQGVKNKQIKAVKIWNHTLREPVADDLEYRLHNKHIVSIDRRGKFIIFTLEKGFVVAHLGMTGKFLIQDELIDNKFNRLALVFSDDTYLVYNDIRKFGFFTYEENYKTNKYIRKLGIEPLSNEFTGEKLYELASKQKMNLKQFLLDQSFIVGLGNIYVLELMYICRMNPFSKAKDMTREQADLFAVEAKKILQRSIELGGSSISDYRDAFDKVGNFQQTFNVYQKTVDPLGYQVVRVKQNGRSTFYVPELQTPEA